MKDISPNAPFVTPKMLAVSLDLLASRIASPAKKEFYSVKELALAVGYSEQTVVKMLADHADKIRVITASQNNKYGNRRRYNYHDFIAAAIIQ